MKIHTTSYAQLCDYDVDRELHKSKQQSFKFRVLY